MNPYDLKLGRAVIFYRILSIADSLIFLPKASFQYKMVLLGSNRLHLLEMVVNEL